jgi:hypothetical protein
MGASLRGNFICLFYQFQSITNYPQYFFKISVIILLQHLTVTIIIAVISKIVQLVSGY